MTYDFTNRGALRRYRNGMGDEDSDNVDIFLPFINAIASRVSAVAAADAASIQAQVDADVKKLSGAPPVAPPVTQTASGGTSSASVGGGDFKIVGGVAKPNNFVALATAKDFQVQVNRVGKAKGLGTTSVDGAIGPGTIALTNKVSLACGGNGANTIGDLITHLSSSTSDIKKCADGMGAPQPSQSDLVKAAVSGTITVTAANGKQQEFTPPGVHPTLFQKIKGLPDTVKILGGAAIVMGGLLAFKRIRRGRSSGGAPSAPKLLVAAPAAPASNPYRRRRRRRR